MLHDLHNAEPNSRCQKDGALIIYWISEQIQKLIFMLAEGHSPRSFSSSKTQTVETRLRLPRNS